MAGVSRIIIVPLELTLVQGDSASPIATAVNALTSKNAHIRRIVPRTLQVRKTTLEALTSTTCLANDMAKIIQTAETNQMQIIETPSAVVKLLPAPHAAGKPNN